jgi:hypothetical protein
LHGVVFRKKLNTPQEGGYSLATDPNSSTRTAAAQGSVSASVRGPNKPSKQKLTAVHFARLGLNAQIDSVRSKIVPPRATSYEDFMLDACKRAMRRYRPCPYSGRVAFFRHHYSDSLVDRDPTAWRRLVQGSYAEYVVDFHDRGKVTSASAKSGYSEIAAKLKEMNLNTA